MENLIVGLSNLPAVFPICTAYIHHDTCTELALWFVAVASFLSHLVENHKHDMPGIVDGISEYVSYALNRVDVCASFFVVLRIYLLLYPNLDKTEWKDWFLALGLFGLSRLSEYDAYNPKLKRFYIITHSIWHIGIFLFLNRILNKYIYN